MRNERHSTRSCASCGELFRVPALGVLLGLAAMTAAPVAAWAQGYTLLYSFQCGPNDGEYPEAGLVSDATGNLYGTTVAGGTYSSGTIFELSPEGMETILHSFAGPPGDGLAPAYGALLRDAAGDLYGTTSSGGTSDVGTVFKQAPNGKETILANLSGSNGYPYSGLIQDSQGNLYATASGAGRDDYGSVFEVTRTGKLSTLYSFTAGLGGERPVGGLVRDSAGNLYGTTELGGSSRAGTVFEVTGGTEGAYSLTKQSGGAPEAGLVRDAAGNLYGTTSAGTASDDGSVFRLSPTDALTVMHKFTGSPDGATPYSGLVRDPSGNFYGITYYGGTGTCDNGIGTGCGTIFEITSKGTESVLYSFTGAPDGSYPIGSALLRDGAGNLYGATEEGGTYGCGTVFEYMP